MEESGPAALIASTPAAIADRYRLRMHRVGIGVLLFAALSSLLQLAWTGQWLRAIIPAFALGLALLLWRLLYTQRHALGFRIGVFGCTALVAGSVAIFNGVHGLSVSILAMLVLLSGWLVSPRTSLALAALIIAWLFALAFATDRGWPYPVMVNAGPYYAALVHATTVAVGGALGYFGASALSAQIRALERRDAQLRENNQLLERRVAERTQDLQAANKELQAFSYSVAHDLRAPLRVINGHVSMLLEDEAQSLSDAAIDHLRRIEKGTLRMDRLVEDLLRLAQVGRADLQLTELQLADFASEAGAMFHSAYPAARLQIQTGMPPARGDMTLMRQVMQNLIGNALKFSSRRDAPLVEVGWDGAKAAWFVRDNGIGMDMRFADKAFETFQRMHTGADYEGTGIGLAIVRRAIERHRGTIWIESEPDRGATFLFTLALTENP
jgi:signal transduction histidine kinase